MPPNARRWRVLVADDEPAARRGVQQLLAPYREFQVVGECRDGPELLTTLEAAAADAVFLDIQMPGMNGFDVIRRRSPVPMPPVIFLTAYDQFAVAAFEVAAFDYLVKPVSEARFRATIGRLSRHLARTATDEPPTLVVSTARGTALLPLADIDWIEAADNYAKVWSGGKSYLQREAIRSLERRTRSHGFVRIHRRALVRLAAIRRIERSADGDLTALLKTGAALKVSRRQRPLLLRTIRELGGGPS